MEIMSYRWGVAEALEIPDEAVLQFPQGIIGFEDQTSFALLEDTESAVRWLQSLDDPVVAFAVLDPFLIEGSYAFDLNPADAKALSLKDVDDIGLYVILTVRLEPEEQITANLLAPIVINTRRRVGRQVVLQDSSYSIQHQLQPEVTAAVA